MAASHRLARSNMVGNYHFVSLIHLATLGTFEPFACLCHAYRIYNRLAKLPAQIPSNSLDDSITGLGSQPAVDLLSPVCYHTLCNHLILKEIRARHDSQPNG